MQKPIDPQAQAYNHDANSLATIDHSLQIGLKQLQLKLPPTSLDQIIAYINLLAHWNKVYSLTAITEPQSMLTRHIFDSLAVSSLIKGPDILDFGTGAGLPGIPLALALPEYNFILLDSSSKKTAFLTHVALTLKIKNIKIMTNRIEEFHFDPLFATIITRATTQAAGVIKKTSRLCAPAGQILIMKGKYPEAELAAIKQPFKVYRLTVPYLHEERHLIKIINSYDSKNYRSS